MGEHLIRLDRLKAYAKSKGWSDAELARQIGRTQQQVHSWEEDRLIGEKLARRLEDKLGLPQFYLDDRSIAPKTQSEPETRQPESGGSKAEKSVNNALRSVPILAWDQLNAMLAIDDAIVSESTSSLDTYAVASRRAKFVRLVDDSMAPNLQPGDHVLLDPLEAPHAGDVVLVRLPSGEHFVRTFRPRTAYVFEATALNPNYQSLTSAEDGAEVVAVMVEHRSYRRKA